MRDSRCEPMRLRDVVGYSSSSTPPRPTSPALSSSPEIALRDQLRAAAAAAQPADSSSPAKRKATTDANGGSPKRPKQSPSSDADALALAPADPAREQPREQR